MNELTSVVELASFNVGGGDPVGGGGGAGSLRISCSVIRHRSINYGDSKHLEILNLGN